MTSGRIAALLVGVAIAGAIGWQLSGPGAEAPGPSHVEEPVAQASPAPAPSQVVPAPVHAPASHDDAPADSHGAEADVELPDPFGDLAYYADYPLSDVPHRVVRGWGAGPRSRLPGAIGLTIVVDPALGDEELTELVRDVRDFHRSARAVAVRVFDSMRAATYDRHEDGGELLARHLVATVQRNEPLGVDSAEVRGEPLEAILSGGGAVAAPD